MTLLSTATANEDKDPSKLEIRYKEKNKIKYNWKLLVAKQHCKSIYYKHTWTGEDRNQPTQN